MVDLGRGIRSEGRRVEWLDRGGIGWREIVAADSGVRHLRRNPREEARL